MIENIITQGLISGGIYALLALGFTLIYGVSGVVNLAHGSFYMIGAYMFYVFGNMLQISPFLSLILAVVSTAIIAAITHRLSIHPVLGDDVGVMVATICLALIFQQIIILVFGSTQLSASSLIEGSTAFLGVNLQYSRILAFGVSMTMFGILWMIIKKSKIGNAMMAVSQDREATLLMGVNVNNLYLFTMTISAMLAAVAGVFVTGSTYIGVMPWMWHYPLSLSFSIVLLGGLGSIKGSLIGGLIIGIAEQALIYAHTEGFAIVSIVPFSVMVAVLLLRPKGLFGKRIEMED